MKDYVANYLLVFALFASMPLSSTATSQSINGPKTYRLGSVGNLQMTVPSNWQDVFKTLDEPAGVTLAYHLPSKKDFYMKVTAVWLPPEVRSSREAGWVRRAVEQSAHALVAESSKTDPTLIEIRSANGSGYYFQLPHKDKLPIGEFSYVTEGILDLGEVTFVFTTFSTSKDLTEIADSLRVVESAHFVNTSGATQQLVGPSDEFNPQKWVSYASAPGKFKIKFPAEPHESSEVQEGESGPSTVHIAEYKGLLYYVTTYGDSASPIDDAKGFLNKVSASWLDANSLHNIHLLSNDPISFNNYPGRVVVVETQMEVIRARWIVVRDRVYYQFVLAPKRYKAPASENGYAKLAAAFFDSFELIR